MIVGLFYLANIFYLKNNLIKKAPQQVIDPPKIINHPQIKNNNNYLSLVMANSYINMYNIYKVRSSSKNSV